MALSRGHRRSISSSQKASVGSAEELAKQEIMEKNHELFTQNQELRQRMDRMDFLLSKVSGRQRIHGLVLVEGAGFSFLEVFLERLRLKAAPKRGYLESTSPIDQKQLRLPISAD